MLMLLNVYFILQVLFLIKSASKNLNSIHFSSFCPVSTNLNSFEQYSNDYFYSYPIQKYGTLFNATGVVECGACDLAAGNITVLSRYNCSTDLPPFCPINEQNIVDSMHVSKSRLTKQKSATLFCNLQKNLHDSNKTSNVIYFGGSVTAGCASYGCSKNWSDHLIGKLSGCFNPYCSWTSRFGEWMNRTFAAKINSISLAKNGYNTILTAETMIAGLRKAGVYQLTGNDIIFADFSVNDYDERQESIEQGLELFIRKLYSHSLITLDGIPSYPTIIILDVYPKFNELNVGSRIAYQNIANYYHLPIWSFRDMANSNYSQTQQIIYNKRLRFMENLGKASHPPWDVHLFQADLYASNLLTLFNHCTAHLSTLTQKQQLSRLTHTEILFNKQIQIAMNSTFSFSNKNTTNHECSATQPPYLDLNYHNIKSQSNRGIGLFRSEPQNAWQLREDQRGAAGFIYELNISQPGLNISNIPSSRLIFTLHNITKERMINEKIVLFLQLNFLRTYVNAGRFYLKFCDTVVKPRDFPYGVSDALWGEYSTYRYSLPSLRVETLSYSYCLSQTNSTENTPVTLEIIHVPSVDLPKVRLNQKVKILSVVMCVQ